MGGGVRYRVVEQGDSQLVEEIHKVVVHRFKMGDVEDPDIYVAEPLWKWQQSDAGKFVMENSVTQPEWHKHQTIHDYGLQIAIVAELEKKKLSEFYLRWGKPEWK
jgi:hypothetical protein